MDNPNIDEFIGKTVGFWSVLGIEKYNEQNPIYQCVCINCNFNHVVSRANLISNITCLTCKGRPKSSVSDVVDLFGGLLGIDDNKKKEIGAAFEKLNQPEFKEIYSSLEQASKSIKDVMSGNSGAPDIARKVLEFEAVKLKKAFGGLIDSGKITEEEARIFKTEIHSSTNMQKLKSVLEVMKRQQRETKKVKI